MRNARRLEQMEFKRYGIKDRPNKAFVRQFAPPQLWSKKLVKMTVHSEAINWIFLNSFLLYMYSSVIHSVLLAKIPGLNCQQI